MEKVMSEVVEHLAQRGLNIAPHQIRHGFMAGHFSRPRLSKSLNFHFSPKLVSQIERYFEHPRPQGRPTKD